jgi:hypothetical protein
MALLLTLVGRSRCSPTGSLAGARVERIEERALWRSQLQGGGEALEGIGLRRAVQTTLHV